MSLAAFPIGTRVRVNRIIGRADGEYDSIIGKIGVVTAHEDPYLDVVVEGHRASSYDKGWLLLPDEVEVVPSDRDETEKGGA